MHNNRLLLLKMAKLKTMVITFDYEIDNIYDFIFWSFLDIDNMCDLKKTVNFFCLMIIGKKKKKPTNQR